MNLPVPYCRYVASSTSSLSLHVSFYRRCYSISNQRRVINLIAYFNSNGRIADVDIAFESSSTSCFQWKAFRHADVDSNILVLQTGCIVLLYLYYQVASSLSILFFEKFLFISLLFCCSFFLEWHVNNHEMELLEYILD